MQLGGMQMFEFDAWKRVLFEPEKVFDEQKQKANLDNAIKWVSAISAISSAAIGLKYGNAASAVAYGIAGLFFGAIVFLITCGLEYQFAKWLGGKGELADQAYFTALISVPIGIIEVVFFLSPLVMGITLIVIVLLVLYQLYLHIKILSRVYQLSAWRAIVTLVLSGIVLGLAFFVLKSLLGNAYSPGERTVIQAQPIKVVSVPPR
jgi:hypothetical protein